jgi:hypothetical protein
MADDNATETAVTMVDGNHNGKWPTAMAMGGGNGDGNGVGNGDGNGDGNCNGDGHGKGNDDKERVVFSYAGDVQCCGRGDTLPPPPWTQRKVHSPALRHGGDTATAKSVCSPSRGRVPDSSPWILFCLLFTTTVQFTEQPSVRPRHYSGAQEPYQPIDALPPPLLQEPCQPIDDLPRLLLHFLSR